MHRSCTHWLSNSCFPHTVISQWTNSFTLSTLVISFKNNPCQVHGRFLNQFNVIILHYLDNKKQQLGRDITQGRLQKKTGTATFVTGNHQEGEVEEGSRCVGLIM